MVLTPGGLAPTYKHIVNSTSHGDLCIQAMDTPRQPDVELRSRRDDQQPIQKGTDFSSIPGVPSPSRGIPQEARDRPPRFARRDPDEWSGTSSHKEAPAVESQAFLQEEGVPTFLDIGIGFVVTR